MRVCVFEDWSTCGQRLKTARQRGMFVLYFTSVILDILLFYQSQDYTYWVQAHLQARNVGTERQSVQEQGILRSTSMREIRLLIQTWSGNKQNLPMTDRSRPAPSLFQVILILTSVRFSVRDIPAEEALQEVSSFFQECYLETDTSQPCSSHSG